MASAFSGACMLMCWRKKGGRNASRKGRGGVVGKQGDYLASGGRRRRIEEEQEEVYETGVLEEKRALGAAQVELRGKHEQRGQLGDINYPFS